VADLGCGNGRLLAFLAENGWRGRYLGVDSSPELLAIAETEAGRRAGVTSQWRKAELMTPDAAQQTSLSNDLGRGMWDAVVMLAVLHHIPGVAQRSRLLAACADLLQPQGVLIVSTWQFVGVPRLAARVLAWESVGISPEEIEPGDYLLPWGEDAAGQRYCAAIDELALCRLAEDTGFERVEAFCSDGHEGNLNLYGVFRKRATSSR
jgi:tRNA (uracil-5-)-methyltransferase TRM9